MRRPYDGNTVVVAPIPSATTVSAAMANVGLRGKPAERVSAVAQEHRSLDEQIIGADARDGTSPPRDRWSG